MPTTTPIPLIGIYRGIGLHDQQSEQRLEVVRRHIDEVFATSDVKALAAFCADLSKAPEARIFSARKIEAEYQISADERRNRPLIDLLLIGAHVAALDSD